MLKGASGFSSGIKIFVGVFLIILLAYFGLKFGSSAVNKKATAVQGQITALNASFSGNKNVDNIIDLQERLKEIKISLATKDSGSSSVLLDKISKTVIAGTTLSSYANTDKQVLVTFSTSDFDKVSKQVFNFKRADFVSSVEIKRIIRNSKGIECDAEINLK